MSEAIRDYVTEIDYTFGYYSELNPARHQLPFLLRGMAPTQVGTACELGFGQGLSLAIHAAGSNRSWYGTDFNSSQARFASELMKVSGADCRVFDQTFAEFCSRKDLPQFDYIGLHGIWSWISDQNRKIIVDFIANKLNVGGVVYVSYNTLPGWSTAAPLRHLLTSYTEHLTSSGQGLKQRIGDSLEFAERLFAAEPLYSRANPTVKPRLEKIKDQNRHYLAHEYFNQNWKPMYFKQLSNLFEPAKLTYAGSAHYLDNVDFVNLKKDQLELLNGISDPVFKETVRDYLTNQQFRRDYWVKGSRALSRLEQVEALHALRFVLTSFPDDIQYKINGVLGEMTMNEDVYRPIVRCLSDGRVKSLSGMLAELNGQVNQPQLLQGLQILVGLGHIATAQDQASIDKAYEQTKALNAYLMRKARASADIQHLASPVTGGGFAIGRIPQLFTLALTEGRKNPDELAKFVWPILQQQQQTLLKNGQGLQTEEENISELKEQAIAFQRKVQPLLQALKIY